MRQRLGHEKLSLKTETSITRMCSWNSSPLITSTSSFSWKTIDSIPHQPSSAVRKTVVCLSKEGKKNYSACTRGRWKLPIISRRAALPLRVQNHRQYRVRKRWGRELSSVCCLPASMLWVTATSCADVSQKNRKTIHRRSTTSCQNTHLQVWKKHWQWSF